MLGTTGTHKALQALLAFHHSPSSPAHLSPALAGLQMATVAEVALMSVTATLSPPRCQVPPRGIVAFCVCAWMG